MLFASKALVVVAFAFEQLFEVGFAVEFPLYARKGAKTVRREGTYKQLTYKRSEDY